MHNFCSVLQPPKSTINLLGLGHNVCIALMRPPGNLKTPLLCFKRNLRIKEWVLNNNMKHEDEAYNPKVYIKSIWDPPPVQKNSNRHLETSKPWVMNSTKGISSISYIVQTLFLTPLLWAATLWGERVPWIPSSELSLFFDSPRWGWVVFLKRCDHWCVMGHYHCFVFSETTVVSLFCILLVRFVGSLILSMSPNLSPGVIK